MRISAQRTGRRPSRPRRRRVSRRLRPADVAGEDCFVTCEAVAQDADSCTYFLAGPPGELDVVIARLVHDGILLHMVYSLIAH